MDYDNQLIKKDIAHVWHPCMQMKDFESYPPIIVHEANGCYLHTNKGTLIDGISSWWCKSLGHRHPKVLEAIHAQMKQFEHVISANTTHPKIVALAEQLATITKLDHTYFASDGSSAVEIAMKLALHGQKIKGHSDKNEFIALKNGYHGETLGTMGVSDLGIYTKPYQGLTVKTHFIDNIPYCHGKDDPLWRDAQASWDLAEQNLNLISDQVCALIFEPIIQGAGGMLCYSPDFLQRLIIWAKKHGIYVIADEIMTGIGRLGKWLAMDYMDVSVDMICLSKGLTSGSIPLSCVQIDHSIFELFYGEADGNSFLHSHTYSGHALAVSAAIATLDVIKEEQLIHNIDNLSTKMRQYMDEIAALTGVLENIRNLGGIVAADMSMQSNNRIGNALYQAAIEQGALLRPIGNTLYWLPPLNINEKNIEQLAEITLNSIYKAYKLR